MTLTNKILKLSKSFEQKLSLNKTSEFLKEEPENINQIVDFCSACGNYDFVSPDQKLCDECAD